MDEDDLNSLCKDAPPEEVDQLHRLLHQWAVGPQNSFPVQLALLTRAQWRAAASIPRSVDDSRKGLELHLAEYRKQTAELIGNLERIGREQRTALQAIIEAHRGAVTKTEQRGDQRDAGLEVLALQIKTDLETAAASWKHAKVHFEAERQQLALARENLDCRQNWRDWLVFGGLVIAVLLLGIAMGRLLCN